MKSDGKFYSFPTNTTNMTVNIENIAAMEASGVGTIVTLNVKNNDGNNIQFRTPLSYPLVSAEISAMSEQIWKR